MVRGRGTVAGLAAEVEIYRDEDGVSHVWATTAEDLYFAQGYVHAQDRYLRTMGFARVAEQKYELLPPDFKGVLDAYSRGVNSYMLNRKPRRALTHLGKIMALDLMRQYGSPFP